MNDDGVSASVPLRAAAAAPIAVAIIDASDAEWAGQWAWHLSSSGYAVRTARLADGGRRTVSLHRGLLGLLKTDQVEVDHIDRDKLNNRRSNLRIVTREENAQNLPAIRKTSSHRGVSWDASHKKWVAYVSVSGRQIRVGRFADEQAAADAAMNARHRWLPFSTD